MKVRIGVSLGPADGPDQFAAAVDLLEQAGPEPLGSFVDGFAAAMLPLQN